MRTLIVGAGLAAASLWSLEAPGQVGDIPAGEQLETAPVEPELQSAAAAVESEVASEPTSGDPVAPVGAVSAARPSDAPRAESVPTEVPAQAALVSVQEEPLNPLLPPGEPAYVASQPLAGGEFQAGTGLMFKSEDGRFCLAPRLRAQFRYEAAKEQGQAAEQSVLVRRARLQFKGCFYSKDIVFKTEIAISPHDVGSKGGAPNTSPLLDFYVDFKQVKDLTLRVGQSKIPFTRQRVVSSGDLQLVDRSIINDEFNLDRDIGVDFRSKNLFGMDLLRYYVGVYGGEGRNANQDEDFGMTYLGRVEILPFGMFEDYEEVDFGRGGPRLSVGAAFARAVHAPRDEGVLGKSPADGGTTDMNIATLDAVFKWSGFSFTAESGWRRGERNPGDAVEVDDDGNEVPVPVAAARDGLGVMGQVGYLLPRTRFEVAGRYGIVEATGDDSAMSDQTEMGGGVSYYFAHHPLKLQSDFFQLTEQERGADKLWERRFRVQLQASF